MPKRDPDLLVGDIRACLRQVAEYIRGTVAELSLHSWLYAAARWSSKLFVRFCLELRGTRTGRPS
jgi:hypothetical protein